MKLTILSLPLTISLVLLSFQSQAQTVDTIRGCDDFPETLVEIEACTICNYDIFYGSTFSYTPSERGENCASNKKDLFIGFVTSASGNVAFELSVFGCISGDGLQVGVYDQFNQQVWDCFAPQRSIYSFPNLTPDAPYFIRIAGLSDDYCEFNIQVISGINAGANCTENVSTASSLQPLGLEVFQSSSSTLNVLAPSNGWHLSMVNMQGQNMMSTQLRQGNNQLMIDELVRGTYFISVQNGEQVASRKWVKR